MKVLGRSCQLLAKPGANLRHGRHRAGTGRHWLADGGSNSIFLKNWTRFPFLAKTGSRLADDGKRLEMLAARAGRCVLTRRGDYFINLFRNGRGVRGEGARDFSLMGGWRIFCECFT